MRIISNLNSLRAPAAPTYGHISFADSSTLRVPLEQWSVASRAFDHLDGVPACPKGKTSMTARMECGLTATGVCLGTATLLTSRGPATVPAWLLTTTQLSGPIARVATPDSAATFESQRDTVPSWCSPSAGVSGDPSAAVTSCVASNAWCKPDVLGSITGKTVTYTVECGGATVRPLVYETPTAVVIGAVAAEPPASLAPGTNSILRGDESTVDGDAESTARRSPTAQHRHRIPGVHEPHDALRPGYRFMSSS